MSIISNNLKNYQAYCDSSRELSNRIHALRIEKGFTLKQLSVLSGLSVRTLMKMEQWDKVDSCSVQTLFKLAKALNMKIEINLVDDISS